MPGYGQSAITVPDTHACVGQTGFFKAHRGYGPQFDDVPEMGWVLGQTAQRMG